MEQDTAIQYVPITFKIGVVVLWGLFAPRDYLKNLSGLRGVEATVHSSKDGKIPSSGTEPIKLRLNAVIMPEGILSTQSFFMDVKYLREAGKITFIRQTDDYLMIAEKHHPLML